MAHVSPIEVSVAYKQINGPQGRVFLTDNFSLDEFLADPSILRAFFNLKKKEIELLPIFLLDNRRLVVNNNFSYDIKSSTTD